MLHSHFLLLTLLNLRLLFSVQHTTPQYHPNSVGTVQSTLFENIGDIRSLTWWSDEDKYSSICIKSINGQDTTGSLYGGCVSCGNSGKELCPEVAVSDGDYIVQKNKKNHN